MINMKYALGRTFTYSENILGREVTELCSREELHLIFRRQINIGDCQCQKLQ